MKPPLKLSAIEQEHLQEVYDSNGMSRDELPYTPAYDNLCQEFQDRAFKNAEPEQVYGAMLKYVRSSSNPNKGEQAKVPLNDDQLKQLKTMLTKSGKAQKLLPYSDEFESARNDFGKLSGQLLEAGDFWRALIKSTGPRRAPPPRKAKASASKSDDGDDE